jgi:5-methylcytosine-specific restriction endonuclease McrA
MREAAYRDGDPITRDGVIARVGRRCHLCKKLARLDVNHLHPLAAEVDHLIPISKGGGNVWDNVAIAHRACNVKKSNKAAGDQLRLLTVGGCDG